MPSDTLATRIELASGREVWVACLPGEVLLAIGEGGFVELDGDRYINGAQIAQIGYEQPPSILTPARLRVIDEAVA